ncbi:hypothetical protein BG004_007024, partial [Podila humilis]
VAAMQDSAVLANVIYALSNRSVAGVTGAFEAYYNERFPQVVEDFSISQTMSKSFENSFDGAIIRFTMTHLPKKFTRWWMAKMVVNRPQVSFRPKVADSGDVKPSYQYSLHGDKPPKYRH